MPARYGGGLYALESSPTIRRVKAFGNTGQRGVAAYFHGSFAPIIINDCEFTDNLGASGCGLYVDSGSVLTIEDCLFARNSSTGSGAGAMVDAESITVRRCRFEDNIATAFGAGGGLIILNLLPATPTQASLVTIEECRFARNAAVSVGGGLVAVSTTVEVRGCSFLENSGTSGGGIIADSVDLLVEHCVFARNESNLGTAISGSINDGRMTVDHCTFAEQIGGVTIEPYFSPVTVTNSIAWGNGNAEFIDLFFTSTSASVSYSDIDGGWPGVGKIDVDP